MAQVKDVSLPFLPAPRPLTPDLEVPVPLTVSLFPFFLSHPSHVLVVLSPWMIPRDDVIAFRKSTLLTATVPSR